MILPAPPVIKAKLGHPETEHLLFVPPRRKIKSNYTTTKDYLPPPRAVKTKSRPLGTEG